MVQVAPDGSALSYSTLYGSTGSDNGRAIAVDANQGVYIAGTTSSTTLPTTAGALQSSTAKTNAYGNTGFLAKIDMSSPTMCTSSVFPGSASIPGRGGSFSFNLTIPPGCPWDAAADSFITLNGVTHGMGSTSPIAITGSVPVNNNTSNSQTGAVRIDGATFTINQDAGSCTDPVFSPTMAAFDMNGGLRTIGITLPSPCSWSVVSSAPWLSVTNNPTGTGMGNTTVFASANSFSARTATLTIATKTITITQSGSTCTAVATASGTSFPGAGGTGVVHLTTNSSSCNWSSYSISPWIQVTGSGQGSGSASFIVAGNPGTAPRSGQILVADQTITITQSGGPSGAIASYTASIFAGIPYASGATGDGGPATAASLNAPEGLAFDPTTGNTYIADNGNGRIRVVTPDGKINTFAGGGGSTAENVAPTTASLSPIAVAVDSSGAVYTTDGSRVRKIAQNLINTVAGGTTPGFSGDNGPATSALLRTPNGLAVDQSGNIFISDTGNSRVREVSGGTINTVAGGGSNGLGDGGPATSAALTNPLEIALDASGNLFIADVNYNRIRKVSNGVITTVAGGGAGGNGGQATSASLSYPTGVAVDLLGNLYLSEQYNNSVRRVDTSGIISSIWMRPYSTTATYLVTDSFGNLYVSMQSANVVYKLTPVPTFCSFAVAPTAAESGAGGALTIPVTTTGGCGWSATSDLPWVSVATAAGTGGGNALFTVAANTGAARSGIVYIAGQAVTITQSAAPLGFFPITPCRAVDTRASQGKTGAFGPPNLGAYSGRDFPLLSSACAIPSSAQAYSLNFTVVPPGPLDFLSAWPTNQPFPGVSTLNTPDGSTIANAAIVPAGLNGAITATAGEATDLIIDVNGYFAAPNGQELAFYAVTPCRVADTRASQGKTGAYGPPSLSPYTGRDFPIVASGCGVPASAQAYALNITAVPSGPLDFLSAWPAGHVFPGVSTLNSTHGNTIANAAIVPAGNNGAITVSAGNPTDVVVDVNGYFAPPGMPGALNFYPITPCRAADTRASQGKTGAFGPPGLTGYNGRDFPLPSSGCNIPTTAKAYALNITVVPQGPLDFLSIWPAGQTYPGVSTLNSPKGNVIANMAIVPAGNNGAVTIVVGNPADVIIDVNGYFAP
jgi:sugar lactone lactonase YvrE